MANVWDAMNAFYGDRWDCHLADLDSQHVDVDSLWDPATDTVLAANCDFGMNSAIKMEEVGIPTSVSDGRPAQQVPAIKVEVDSDNVLEMTPQHDFLSAVEDAVRSDLMWSSTLKIQRRRGTLSECVEGLLSEIDVLGKSPVRRSRLADNNTEQPRVPSNTPVPFDSLKEEDEEEEEEDVDIDACSDADSQSTCSATPDMEDVLSPASSSNDNNSYQDVQAGRSLLLRNQPSLLEKEVFANQFIARDHCYFTTSKPPSPSSGMLTPVESSEDEDELAGKEFQSGKRGSKRKLADYLADAEDSVKFKIKMAVPRQMPSRRREQKSDIVLVKIRKETKTEKTFEPQFPVSLRREESYGSDCSSAGNRAAVVRGGISRRHGGGNDDASKWREIRNMHNSMERQRRVDLRVNFDLLRDAVAEEWGACKPSKLMILNKATEAIRLLSAQEQRLRVEREGQARRGQELRRKLAAVKAAWGKRQPLMQPQSKARKMAVGAAGRIVFVRN
jgi:hypothetical protein